MTRVTQIGDSKLLHDAASALRPITRVADCEDVYSLADRMAHYHVPAFSVALFDRGELVAAGAYGAIDSQTGPAVDVETLFQAASMSKMVSAFIVLQLVADGTLSLDEDVNDKLVSWRVPVNEFTRSKPVTLRRIMSHRAGLTVHGFPGFAEHETMPTLAQILSGRRGAITGPVLVDAPPDAAQRYSGGGTSVAQQLVEDVTGMSFADVARRRVFEPLDMHRSTFVIPLSNELAANAAHRHDTNGTPLRERWRYYPQMAAAGLWTTPSEFGRFLAEIHAAWHGRSLILDREMARAMLTRGYGDSRGLGPTVHGNGPSLRYSHDGSNAGFHCGATMYAQRGLGAVAMTNALQGPSLWREYFNGIAAQRVWPDYLEAPVVPARLNAAELERLVGRYRIVGAVGAIRIWIEDGRLRGGVDGMPVDEFVALSPTEFRSQRTPYVTRFELGASGGATGLEVLEDGEPFVHAQRDDSLQ